MKFTTITRQREERDKCILSNLQKFKKLCKKKNDNFLSFAEKLVSKYSIKFLQDNETKTLYEHVYLLYKQFIQNLNKELFVNVSCDISTHTKEKQNRFVIKVLLEDRPFVVDSLRNYFHSKQNLNIIQLTHPVLFVEKQEKNIKILLNKKHGCQKYNYVIVLVSSSHVTELDTKILQEEIYDVLSRLIAATNDFHAMQNTLRSLKDSDTFFTQDQQRDNERRQLYEWIASDNMILLGINSISSQKICKKKLTWNDFDNNLGVFSYLAKIQNLDFVEEIEQYLPIFKNNSLSVSFAESRYSSKIHVTDKLIYIFGKKVYKNTDKITFFCLAGVFTRASELSDIMDIPLVRYKLNAIVKDIGLVENSHDFKHLKDLFNRFPKYECFRMEKEELRIFAYKSPFIWELCQVETSLYSIAEVNYARLVVYIPVENFDDREFKRVSQLMTKTTKQEAEKSYWFYYGNSVQCHFIYFKFDTNKISSTMLSNIELEVKQLIEEWQQILIYKLEKHFSHVVANKMKQRYSSAFNKFYQAANDTTQAIYDIENFNLVVDKSVEYVDVIALNEEKSIVVLYTYKIYHLSQILPNLQNLSLDVLQEIAYKVPLEGKIYHKYTYIVKHQQITIESHKYFKKHIQESILALFSKELANEKLNGLVTCAGFNYKQVNLFTALKKYMYQLGCSIDSNIFDCIILVNPKISYSILDYFTAKFTFEKKNRKTQIIQAEQAILVQIAKLKTLTEDGIFRNLYNFVQAMLRTNYYNINAREALAFKINCSEVDMMQNPKPMYEIFVYGVDMTGVHLRGGKIARGGLRFSDRKDDFRTEILGLMSAQMLKNTVIVPEGSKGGFIIDESFTTRKEMFQVVEKHYRRFVQSLLSITGNFIQGEVIPPKQVVRYDDNDPYLVVAADKGTAHLSDVANEISLAQNFWLGDAFASGGSIGYNHKEIGITAKGAWECIKIHFLELGIDIQNEDFSVVGIGDMGGDVFGNAMLLSHQIRLKGAFNHLHIFIDPYPPTDDSAWQERKRLFQTAGSSWVDYKTKLISKGGGVFKRNSKSITLTSSMKEFLQTKENSVSGEKLIRMLLSAKVDLLWNGGIGTYVKSKNQTQLDVGDPNNNSVRVNAADLKTKIVGEGGNLGFTQSARLEFALQGGKINADSIDNSAGVDMSDHEVNIKIMMERLIEKKKIKAGKERVKLLATLIDEVTAACLKNNQDQSYILSMSMQDSKENLSEYLDTIDFLVEEKIINPNKEKLLSKSALLEYGDGIPRPYLCSLLSYTKMFFFRKILNSNLPDNKFCEQYFLDYFPSSLSKKFSLLKHKHQLYREIITSRIINQQINQFGIPFLTLLQQWSDRPYDLILKTYIIADNIFYGKKIRKAIFTYYQGKNILTAYTHLRQLEVFLRKITLWLLLNLKEQAISFDLISKYQNLVITHYPKLSISNIVSQAELLQLLKTQQTSINPLEKIYLVDEQKLTKQLVEEIFQKTYRIFGLSIGDRLIKMKVVSSYGKQHVGLLLQNINSLKWKIYKQILKKYQKFLASPQEFFDFPANSLLQKIQLQEDFFTKNARETLHVAAVLIEEINNFLQKK